MRTGNERTILPLDQELVERVGWFVKLRWFAATGVFAATLAGKVLLRFDLLVLELCIIGLGIFIYNTVFWRYFLHIRQSMTEGFKTVSGRRKVSTRFIHAQIAMDWVALTLLAHYSGGTQSPIILFFIFHLLIASILLSRRDCYLQATLVVVLVTSFAFLEHLKVIPHVAILDSAYVQPMYIRSDIVTLFFFAATLYFAVFLATSIAAALKEKERSLTILQADLQEAYNDLEEAATAKSRFILMVTHELRSPLAAVQSMLTVISEGYAGDVSEKSKELIERSESRIVVLLELVSELLDAERLSETRREQIDVRLSDVIVKVSDGIQGRAEAKGVSLEVNIPEDHVVIKSYGSDLERLFGNLLSNAVKYTPPGGTARLTVDASEDVVNFVVTDTGIGIPEEAMENLFTEFFRAENARKTAEYGTGIGLSVVKRIVDEHNGEISVESELGKGTQFSVSLPLRTQ
ncbi:sensor histidine kinase [Candidatus Poribacteria bacterium]